MGFDVVYVADIQKFPNPLFTKYKHNFRAGSRLDIPAIIGDFYVDANTVFPPNKYELLYVVTALTGYKDGDSWSLYWNDTIIFNSIYFKEYSEKKHMQPVKKFNPEEDILRFVFHNLTGTSKVLFVDFECSCRQPVSTESRIYTTKVVPFLALNISPGSNKNNSWFKCTITSTISCTIYYTLDKTDPTILSTVYTVPLNINGYAVVRAMGIDDYGNMSSIVQVIYGVVTPSPKLQVQATPSGGSYTDEVYISISSNKSSTIYYTLDGTVPNLESDTYNTPIYLVATTTLKYFAVSDDGLEVTEILTEEYVISDVVIVNPDIEYLKMFVTTDTTDTNYVSIESVIDNYPDLEDYWHMSDGSQIDALIPKEFYGGHNAWRDIWQSTDTYSNNATIIRDDFYIRLWKLVKDSQNSLIIPELGNSYTDAKSYMNSIGITDQNQQASIYASFFTRCVNVFFPTFTSIFNMNNDGIDGFMKYVDRSKCFVFDWIDWCDLMISPSTGGYATSLVNPISGFKSALNIEPQTGGFTMGPNGTEKVWQYKYVNGNAVWYVLQEGEEDPYDTQYSWNNIDDATTTTKAQIGHVGIHEMGHSVDSYAKYRGDIHALSYTDEWIDIWKWDSVASSKQALRVDPYQYPKYLTDYHMNWNMNNGEPPLTWYGCTSCVEDFAESYACYRTNEIYLQEKYPKRYAFMKNFVDQMNEV